MMFFKIIYKHCCIEDRRFIQKPIKKDPTRYGRNRDFADIHMFEDIGNKEPRAERIALVVMRITEHYLLIAKLV